jgi:thiol-disulfide isomerase/thioredoxin
MWGAEKYTQTKAPASLDDLLAGGEVQIVRRALENAFLLDSLLRPTTDVTHLAGNGIVAPVYVSLDTLEGEKAHHLRFSNGSTRELWLADSPLPLPLKVEGELPLTDEEKERKFAKAEFSVEFKNWLPDVKLDPKVFQFDAKSKGKRASGFLPDLPPHPLLNQPAPAAVLEVLDGQRTTLAAHKGRDVVVLDFWSASCVPCIGLLPKVDAVARKFKGRGVVFYAMNENDAADDVRRFVNARGIGLTVTLHNKTANFDAFKVDAIPMLFVIDKSGVIRVVHTVHSNDLNAELTAQIEALLAGRTLQNAK